MIWLPARDALPVGSLAGGQRWLEKKTLSQLDSADPSESGGSEILFLFFLASSLLMLYPPRCLSGRQLAVSVPDLCWCRPVMGPVWSPPCKHMQGSSWNVLSHCEGWRNHVNCFHVTHRDKYTLWHHLPEAHMAFKEKGVITPRHRKMLVSAILTLLLAMGL